MVQAMADCGCRLNNAYMQHSLLALVVIPEIRISDHGIIDVTKFEKTELFVIEPHFSARPCGRRPAR
jgi:adenine deaminase